MEGNGEEPAIESAGGTCHVFVSHGKLWQLNVKMLTFHRHCPSHHP